jgi:hypothetical protein
MTRQSGPNLNTLGEFFMQFRTKKLALALGAAFSAVAAVPAFALAPASYTPPNNNVPNGPGGSAIEVFISGASAQDTGLRAVIARMCTVGTLDRYDLGSTQAAFYCTPLTTLGLSKTQLIIYKSSDKGSGNGVLPLVSPGSNVAFLKMGDIKTLGACTTTSTSSSVTVSGDALGVPAYTVRTCVTSGTISNIVNWSVKPDGGLSDVEPPFFTTGATTGITPASANSVTFGFIVSKNLYRALQRAQGLTGGTDTSADTNNNSSVTGITTLPIQDNEANMPSLTRDTIASLFSGITTDWNSLVVATSTTASSALNTFSGADNASDTSHPAPSDHNVYIARRVPSSGTEKSAELFLFGGTTGGSDDGLGFVPANGFPAFCNAHAIPMISNGTLPNADLESVCTTPAGQTVFAGSATGNVRNCVSNHYTGNRWAIGIVSTESAFATGNSWRFIKIDGQSPSLLNVGLNRYKHWVSQSANTPSYARNTDAASVVSTVFTNLGSQGVLKAVNQSLFQPWGAGSLFALQENGATPDAPPNTMAQVQANPGLPLTRAALGSTDNCQQPLYLSPVQINLNTSPNGTQF